MTWYSQSTKQNLGTSPWIFSVLRPIYLFASVSPLTAAVIAPLAVLLDIPALTEKWYTRNGEPRPDPRPSLILSGLSLGFSLIANALLVVRFSLQGRGWTIATRISVACWVIKVVTGICNLVVFGALTRNQPQFSYAEGFWSAVVSVIASGIILALLLLHWTLQFKRDPSQDDQPSTPSRTKLQIRVAGRHFMLQNTTLIALIALTALIFSRINQPIKEEWTYLQGIYFTIVTFLTIGFGDFYPTKPSTKVLLFPLGLLGVTLLASCISMMVSFFNEHQREHKARARAERAPLIRIISLVIFIVYSLMAVPIMASFAVQAIQNILERLSEQRMDRRRAQFGDETSQAIAEVQLRDKHGSDNHSTDEMHSTLVARFHSKKGGIEKNTDVAMNVDDLKALLEYAVSLERVARRLLVAHLEEGSPAQILLRADWNLQSRDLRVLESESQGRNSGRPHVSSELGEDSNSKGPHKANMHGLAAIEAGVAGTSQSREEREEEEIAETAVGGMDDEETLKAVREFRRNVAGMLALGSRLRELEGTEKYIFERRRAGD
ncbi:hypothetical protein RSAG8_10671, partial [Rhizoctonia solani AG-8 WAC10335]